MSNTFNLILIAGDSDATICTSEEGASMRRVALARLAAMKIELNTATAQEHATPVVGNGENKAVEYQPMRILADRFADAETAFRGQP